MDSIRIPKLFACDASDEAAPQDAVAMDDGDAWDGGPTTSVRLANRHPKAYKVCNYVKTHVERITIVRYMK